MDLMDVPIANVSVVSQHHGFSMMHPQRMLAMDEEKVAEPHALKLRYPPDVALDAVLDLNIPQQDRVGDYFLVCPDLMITLDKCELTSSWHSFAQRSHEDIFAFSIVILNTRQLGRQLRLVLDPMVERRHVKQVAATYDMLWLERGYEVEDVV